MSWNTWVRSHGTGGLEAMEQVGYESWNRWVRSHGTGGLEVMEQVG